MKRGFIITVAAILFLSTNVEAVLNGSGTEMDPYLIQSRTDFDEFASNSSYWDSEVYTKLMCDIDLAGTTYTQAVIGPNDLTSFNGTFDGEDYEIRNISIDLPNKDYVGVFGFLDSDAEIINLRIENADITGKRYVGGLAGYNLGTLSNCRTNGTVSGKSASCAGGLAGLSFGGNISGCRSDADMIGTGATLGGLVGYHSSGTISNCSASGNITDTDPNAFGSISGGLVGSNFQGVIENCSATGDVLVTSASDYVCVGGIAGTNSDRSTILNSYAKGNVYTNSTSAVSIVCGGGFVGFKTASDVNDCYALGSVLFDCPAEPNGFFGGLFGLGVEDSANRCYSIGIVSPGDIGGANFCIGGLSGFNMDGTIDDSFWDTETSGQLTSDGGTGKTTAEMVTLSSFMDAGWDFESTWRICDGMNYPRLKWEPKPIGDFVCPEGVEVADLMILSEEWLAETMSADIAPDGGDGIINLLDWTRLANAWLSDPWQPNWDEACDLEPFSVAPIIDEGDLMVFSEQWLSRSAHYADIAPKGVLDSKVDLLDYAIFAENWMLGVE